MLGVTGLVACNSSDLQTPTGDHGIHDQGLGLPGARIGRRAGGGRQWFAHRRSDRGGAHRLQNTFLALSLICPHQGTTVQIAGAAFYCPGHGAMFAADGSWTGGQATS